MIDTQEQKIRLYLDTSVISAIKAPHKPKAEEITQQFFLHIKERADEYELATSMVVDAEVDNCPEPKRSILYRFLENTEHIELLQNDAVDALTEKYIDHDVLHKKHIRDLTHIAYAVVNGCDYIVSWNFEHFVNPKTIKRVNTVNRDSDYPQISIVTPAYFLGDNL